MTRYEFLDNLLPIIYPEFYVSKDADLNELVFLDLGNHEAFENIKVTDKTQCEAVGNHVHIFDKIGIKSEKTAIKIGISIAENLRKSLTGTFPNKKFIVYLTVQHNDSTIIRFHQIWEDEPLYIDKTAFNDKNLKIFEFRT